METVHMLMYKISIHAPVKGATRRPVDPVRGRKISIHAPVKGATARQACLPPCWSISIHAPVKGATSPLIP